VLEAVWDIVRAAELHGLKRDTPSLYIVRDTLRLIHVTCFSSEAPVQARRPPNQLLAPM
jgi:hypothetical protein